MMDGLTIRRFRNEDALSTAQLFFDSVRVGTGQHYNERERLAWAAETPTTCAWLKRLSSQAVFVAEANGAIAGFMTLTEKGCIDLAYVAPHLMRKGIGGALYESVEAEAFSRGVECLWTEASHLARGFFEKHGWSILEEQSVVRNGVKLTNYLMEKGLV
jgi:putative acetyltransferase